MSFERYCADAIYNAWELPYGHIMRKMGIQAVESTLPQIQSLGKCILSQP